MGESSIVKSKTISPYLRNSLLQAALEKFFEPLKGCGSISINMKIGDCSGLRYFSVIMS